MNTVGLVRHGENRANQTGEFSHRIVDYPLTPLGWRQARCTATYRAHFPSRRGLDDSLCLAYERELVRANQRAGRPCS